MPDIQLPTPKLLVRVLMNDANNLEAKTDRYTFEEITEILNNSTACKFWAKDENDTDVYIHIRRPTAILAYIILDYMSYEKTVRNLQLAKARQAGHPSPIIQR